MRGQGLKGLTDATSIRGNPKKYVSCSCIVALRCVALRCVVCDDNFGYGE